MKRLAAITAAAWLTAIACAQGAEPGPRVPAKPAGPLTESIEARSDADTFRVEKDHAAAPRDFVQQPPLIPHSTKGYNITKNFNKCMDCHAWSRYEQTGATKVTCFEHLHKRGFVNNFSTRRVHDDRILFQKL